MSDNKSARKALEKLYGKECFIEKLHLRKDDEPRTYTSSGQMKKMKQLTYHHIKMKKDGGKATVENGVLLSIENHTWFHKQSKEKQAEMNQIFQDYKKQVDECKVVLVDNLEVPYKIKPMEFSIKEKENNNKDNKGNETYSRAKEKQEVRKMSEEYIDR